LDLELVPISNSSGDICKASQITIILSEPGLVFLRYQSKIVCLEIPVILDNSGITFIYHVTYEGQEYTITIPAGKAVAYADTPWYGPLWLLANYGGNNAPTGAKGNGTYIVKAGDTLTGISVKIGVTIQYLVDKNNIKNANVITVGQLIEY